MSSPRHPLFAASALVEDEILASGDRFTNGSSLIPLNKISPFIMLTCTHSGDRLAPNQSVGCGSLVSELRNTGKRHLRFKLLATSKPSTKFPVSSDVATAQLPQPTPSNAPSVLTSHQTSVPTGPPTSSTTTHYPAESYVPWR